ncbi:pilus assembly PilX family protein [Nitrogeniibacter mangrovi]|uniref:pilus assembly PilX family protein n=1 Tax=Nitrogeniibacter mangrovi TaxID=2016596 RepID=UPI001C2D2D73|nr:PilX N-terminal domain-containing pilus assembly protein [Nitrogeniibacter mangrovi]
MLIVGVIFLLVMTMLGITAMQTTSLEERMAGNMLDRGKAFQAAELALRAGEAEVFNGPPNSGAGFFDVDTSPAPDASSAANWTTANIRASTWPTNAFPQLKAEPEYWIERRTGPCVQASLQVACERIDAYDITARSGGASGNAIVILRSTALY